MHTPDSDKSAPGAGAEAEDEDDDEAIDMDDFEESGMLELKVKYQNWSSIAYFCISNCHIILIFSNI